MYGVVVEAKRDGFCWLKEVDLLGVEWFVALMLCLTSVVTAAISAATGMGGGVLLFFAILQGMPLGKTVPVHGFVQMFANVQRLWLLRRHLDGSINVPFLVGAIGGVVTIRWVISWFHSETIPYVLILGLILYSVFKPSQLPELKIPSWGFGILGYATGFLAILIGAVDPILAPFFIRDDFEKESVVANKSFMQAVIHVSKLPVFFSLGFAYQEYWGLLAFLVLGSLVGTYVGVLILEKVERRWFLVVFKSILFLVGCNIAYKLVIAFRAAGV